LTGIGVARNVVLISTHIPTKPKENIMSGFIAVTVGAILGGGLTSLVYFPPRPTRVAANRPRRV
jgi:hypothetical protein